MTSQVLGMVPVVSYQLMCPGENNYHYMIQYSSICNSSAAGNSPGIHRASMFMLMLLLHCNDFSICLKLL